MVSRFLVCLLASVACSVALAEERRDASGSSEENSHFSGIARFYAELDWQGNEPESGLIVMYFPEPVAYDGRSFTRVSMFFQPGSPSTRGYEDPSERRIVLKRNLRDFSAVLALLRSDSWRYVSWSADDGGRVFEYHILGGDTKRDQEQREGPHPEVRLRSDW